VLTVRGLRTAKRARQIIHRRVSRVPLHPTGQPRREFLEQPAVAVRIMERRERSVAATFGIGTVDAHPPKQIGFVRTGVRATGVEQLADFDAASQQLGASGLDVGNNQVKALRRAWCRRGNVLAEDD
jgi:hypothetical protein